MSNSFAILLQVILLITITEHTSFLSMLRLSCVLKLVKILVFKNVSCSKSKTVGNLAKHSFARMNVAEFVASSTPATKNIKDIVVHSLFTSAKKVLFSTEASLDNIIDRF